MAGLQMLSVQLLLVSVPIFSIAEAENDANTTHHRYFELPRSSVTAVAAV
jgi:hypothetical protein